MAAQNADANFAARLSTVRHDMRTPVGHIMGYAEMLEEDLEDSGSAEFLRDLTLVHGAGERMLALIDDTAAKVYVEPAKWRPRHKRRYQPHRHSVEELGRRVVPLGLHLQKLEHRTPSHGIMSVSHPRFQLTHRGNHDTEIVS